MSAAAFVAARNQVAGAAPLLQALAGDEIVTVPMWPGGRWSYSGAEGRGLKCIAAVPRLFCRRSRSDWRQSPGPLRGRVCDRLNWSLMVGSIRIGWLPGCGAVAGRSCHLRSDFDPLFAVCWIIPLQGIWRLASLRRLKCTPRMTILGVIAFDSGPIVPVCAK